LDKAIRALVAADEDLKAQDATLQAIKGVGEITSWSVLAYLGEITHRPRNKVVALAGLAPYNRDTGKTQGKRVIHGGRAKLRKVLFMSARVAATHNPVIKAYVQRLTARGMLYKCALVAAMRKLLIFMQSQLRKQQKHNSQLQPQSL
jgi:transposase